MIKVDTGHTTELIRPDREVTRFLPEGEAKAMQELAQKREEAHVGQASTRILSPDYELIGCVGEWGFEDITGLRMDRRILREGDDRVDFQTVMGSLDVKAAAKAFNLLREQHVPHAKILVLAQFYKEPLGFTFLGWEYDAEMVTRFPVKRFMKGGKEGPLNHWKERWFLRGMDDLYFRLGVWGRVSAGLGLGLTEPEEEGS